MQPGGNMTELGTDLDKHAKRALRRLRDEIGLSDRAAELVVRTADREINESTGRRRDVDLALVSDLLARMPGRALARTLELPEQEIWASLRIAVPELMGVQPTPAPAPRLRRTSPNVVVSSERRSWSGIFAQSSDPLAILSTKDA